MLPLLLGRLGRDLHRAVADDFDQLGLFRERSKKRSKLPPVEGMPRQIQAVGLHKRGVNIVGVVLVGKRRILVAAVRGVFFRRLSGVRAAAIKPDHFADRLVEHVAIEDDAREVEIQRGPEFLQVIELAVLQDFLEQDPRAEVRGDRDQLARDLDLLRQAVDQKVQCLLPLP